MDDDKPKATDIIFTTVHTLSLDMIRLVHALVSDATNLENAFISIAKKIQDVRDNLEAHVMSKDWMSRPSKTACKKKMAQCKELVDMCLAYARLVRCMTDQAIKVAESMEDNAKLADISNYVIKELENEHRKREENTDADEPEDEEPHGSD